MKPAQRVAYIAFLLFLLCAHASAQMMSTGIGGGGFGGSAPAYTGPGDVSGWGTQYAMYSFRCNKSAYTGNVAAIRNVAAPAVTTLLTCSSGGTVNQTVNALSTTCATTCEMTSWYDQSGNSRDLNTVSGGGFPVVSLASFAGQLSAIFSAGNLISTTSNATAQAQPISIAAATYFTGTGIVVSDGSFAFQPLVSVFGNGRSQQAGGSRRDYTGVDNSLESIVSVINGASSSMKNNSGSITSNGDPGSNGIGNTNKITVGATDAGGAPFSGRIYEVIITAGARNSTEQNAIVANQRTIGTGW